MGLDTTQGADTRSASMKISTGMGEETENIYLTVVSFSFPFFAIHCWCFSFDFYCRVFNVARCVEKKSWIQCEEQNCADKHKFSNRQKSPWGSLWFQFSFYNIFHCDYIFAVELLVRQWKMFIPKHSKSIISFYYIIHLHINADLFIKYTRLFMFYEWRTFQMRDTFWIWLQFGA